MRSNRSSTVVERLSAELGTNDVCSREVRQGHVITLGRLKDGGILVTSSFNDLESASLRVVSLELPVASEASAVVDGCSWVHDGCVVDERREVRNVLLADRSELNSILPPFPKLIE